jgi:hypothetical protein
MFKFKVVFETITRAPVKKYDECLLKQHQKKIGF